MAKTKVYSVRLKSLTRISDKCYKAVAFDGSEAFIPASQYFGEDYEAGNKSDAYWISAWILEKKELQFSTKKAAWYNPETGQTKPHIEIIIEKHIPARIEPVQNIQPNKNLLKCLKI